MKHLLITGFDPFGGESVNPSWMAVNQLPDQIGEWKLTKLQIPTIFGTAAESVLSTASSTQPDVILCIGQAGGRSAVTPEVVAINLREARIPDNAGQQPLNTPVVEDGPAAYFSTAPVREMIAAISNIGLPASLSYTAGAFVCNDVLYTLLHYFHNTPTRVGFIHVPYLPQQAKDNVPSMPQEHITQALIAAIGVL